MEPLIFRHDARRMNLTVNKYLTEDMSKINVFRTVKNGTDQNDGIIRRQQGVIRYDSALFCSAGQAADFERVCGFFPESRR